MKKIIFTLLFVSSFVAIYIYYGNQQENSVVEQITSIKQGNFSELGYISEGSPSYINDKLVLLYEEPGAPALTVKLIFHEQSNCQFGEQSIQCMALSNPIINIVRGKRVLIEGVRNGDSVVIKNLALDIEADRKFGLITIVEQNGNNLLVTIDEIEFLSGDDAVQAVMKDFACEKTKVEECAPSMNNDFYIRNISKATINYNLTSDSKISVFKNPGSPELESVTLSTFMERSKDPSSLIRSSPFKFIIDGSTITALEQQYTP